MTERILAHTPPRPKEEIKSEGVKSEAEWALAQPRTIDHNEQSWVIFDISKYFGNRTLWFSQFFSPIQLQLRAEWEIVTRLSGTNSQFFDENIAIPTYSMHARSVV